VVSRVVAFSSAQAVFSIASPASKAPVMIRFTMAPMWAATSAASQTMTASTNGVRRRAVFVIIGKD
jgi:hypothetical protein